MFITLGLPHYIPLMALSVLLASLGGYVGLGLAGQAGASGGLRRRGLLAGSAWALGLGIWTMHFVGILAARFPVDLSFSVLLTLLSFLLCVLVVGIAAFLQGSQLAGGATTGIAAVVMGGGIASMHYVGMHAVTGAFGMHHDFAHVIAATALAVAASYAALKLTDARLRRVPLAFSALAFGIAVSGMHYTAMAGMSLGPPPAMQHDAGLSISSDMLTIAVAVLAFLISGVFLLYLVPDGRADAEQAEAAVGSDARAALAEPGGGGDDGQAAPAPAKSIMLPVETEGSTRLLAHDTICAIQATTHYTLIYDGQREYFSPWSISEAEQRLPPQEFMRVHRSHMIAVDKVTSLRRAGDGAAVEVGQPVPRVVPVSRSHYAELKARLGLRQKLRGHAAAH